MAIIGLFMTMARKASRMQKEQRAAIQSGRALVRPKFVNFFVEAYHEHVARRLIRKYYKAERQRSPLAIEYKQKIEHYLQKLPARDRALVERRYAKAQAKAVLHSLSEEISHLEARVFFSLRVLQNINSENQVSDELSLALDLLNHKLKQQLLNHYNLCIAAIDNYARFVTLPERLVARRAKLNNGRNVLLGVAVSQADQPQWQPGTYTERLIRAKLKVFNKQKFKPEHVIEHLFTLFERIIQVDKSLLRDNLTSFSPYEQLALFENEIFRFSYSRTTDELQQLKQHLNCDAYKIFMASLDYYLTFGEHLSCFQSLQRRFGSNTESQISMVLGNLKTRLGVLERCLVKELETRFAYQDATIAPIVIPQIEDLNTIPHKIRSELSELVGKVLTKKHKFSHHFFEKHLAPGVKMQVPEAKDDGLVLGA